MSSMSWSCLSRCTQVAMAACLTLAASACGNGLFTASPTTGSDSGAGSDRPVDVPPTNDGPISPAVDRYPDQPVPSDVAAPDATTPDAAAPDAAVPGSSATAIIDYPGGSVTLGNASVSATVVVPRGAFAQPANVTLTLVAFAPVNDDAGTTGPSGPIGPIFSLSKTVTLQAPASVQLTFTPADTSIPAQRVALAYLNTQTDPNLWIAILPSSYNPTAGVLTGTVVEFSGTRLFAPVESCPTGQACTAPETCQGGACQ
jgi:hypothetical protein